MAQHAGRITLMLALAVAPISGQAIAPVLLVLIKEIAQQAATSMIKDLLLSSLSGMGCKGIALSNALAAFDLRGGAASPGGVGGLAGALGGGMPKLPAGLPGMPSLPSMAGLPGGMATLPNLPGMPALPNLPAGAGLALGGIPSMAGVPPEMAAKMASMMPGAGGMPPGLALDPEQMAMMARLQQSMSQPLSPPETLATIDELFELGFLPRAMQTELKECMVLLPAAIPALGMGMGMLKPMLPQMRQARAELHALAPAEQDEIADLLAQEFNALPADQRAALLEHIDSGFFPSRVSAGVRARVGAK